MQQQIIYTTRTGHTEQLADAISLAIGVQAHGVGELPPPICADLLFLGASIYGGKIEKAMRQFLLTLSPETIKHVAVFGSSAGKKSAYAEIKQILTPMGIDVLPQEYHCPGSFLFSHKGRPNAEDLAGAQRFAREVSAPFKVQHKE